ncbi:hypothetical protein ACNOYE_32005 [Nannocystaceae bacterium ST9]
MPGTRSSSASERPAREAGESSLRADPEAVAAARDATVKLVQALGQLGAGSARRLASGLRAGGRWAWPHLRRAAIGSARASARASRDAARWCWTRRVALVRVGHRVLWWAALALLVLVGRALLGEGRAPGDELWLSATLLWFGIGLAMASVVLLTAPETRMRRAAFALASSHGALALLVWFAGV